MKKLIFLAVAGLLMSGCVHETLFGSKPATQTAPAKESKVTDDKGILTVVLDEQNNSGQEGVVTIQEIDGQLTVIVAATDLNSTPQPAHIHVGQCPNPGKVVYPLTNVVDGESETVLDITMEQLLAQGDLAVNLHKSAQESSVYTACGNI